MASPTNRNRSVFAAATVFQMGWGSHCFAQEPKAMRVISYSGNGCQSSWVNAGAETSSVSAVRISNKVSKGFMGNIYNSQHVLVDDTVFHYQTQVLFRVGKDRYIFKRVTFDKDHVSIGTLLDNAKLPFLEAIPRPR